MYASQITTNCDYYQKVRCPNINPGNVENILVADDSSDTSGTVAIVVAATAGVAAVGASAYVVRRYLASKVDDDSLYLTLQDDIKV